MKVQLPLFLLDVCRKEQLMGQELARLQAELQKVQTKLTTTEGLVRQGEEVRRTLETQNNQYKQQRSNEQVCHQTLFKEFEMDSYFL